jgi:hypothetical protein
MAPTKVRIDELREFLAAGHTQAEAARYFCVSEAAIHHRLKKMRGLGTRVVALERAAQIVDEQLGANARLERIQRVIDQELAWAVEQTQREGSDRAPLQDVILRLTAEVRQQLGLQLAISRTLVDLRVVKEFQETVVDIIQQEEPETARRIIERLKERRALRPSASLPGLADGNPDGFVA